MEKYVAWIIPPAGAGRVQIIDLGSVNDIDVHVAKLHAGIENKKRRNVNCASMN